MKKTSIYFPELDSLRFLAFLLVLICHSKAMAGIPLWVTIKNYGWIGVDLFLCLSAFLFTKLLFVEYRENRDINVLHFYLRRLLRIWPLYFFFFGVVFAYSIYKYGWISSILFRSLGIITFTDNIISLAKGYNMAIVYSTHLWTISYEEQFYLIIPWALRFLYRLPNRSAVYILSAIMLAGMVIRALFIYFQVGDIGIWVLPITHFESIFGGLIIGLGLFDNYLKRIVSWVLLGGGLLSLWLVTLLPNIYYCRWHLMLTYPLVGIGVSLVLVAVMQGNLGFLSVILKFKALNYLGKISYGLYVYHLLGKTLMQYLSNTFAVAGRLLAYPIAGITTTLAITILISALSYRFLEKPFLKMKDRFSFIQSRPI